MKAGHRQPPIASSRAAQVCSGPLSFNWPSARAPHPPGVNRAAARSGSSQPLCPVCRGPAVRQNGCVAKIRDVIFDSRHPASIARFWAAALDDYEVAPYDDAELQRLASVGIGSPQDDPTVLVEAGSEVTPRRYFQLVPDGSALERRRCHWLASLSRSGSDCPIGRAAGPSRRPCALGAISFRPRSLRPRRSRQCRRADTADPRCTGSSRSTPGHARRMADRSRTTRACAAAAGSAAPGDAGQRMRAHPSASTA